MSQSVPDPSAASAESAFAEYLRRQSRGEPVDFDAFCAERPDLALPLRVLRSAHEGAPSFVDRPSLARLVEESFDGGAGPQAPAQKRYRVLREIGRGGMGVVFEVWDEQLDRPLAMKVLYGGRAPESAGGSGSVAVRFLAEAHITAQLDHPGIVPVHDLGIDESGRAFFTMALVEGEDLRRIFVKAREGREGWSITRALGVLVKVCEAVAFAHSRGIIHRDLKPSNVMVGGFGQVYVMDWGLAKRAAVSGQPPPAEAGAAPGGAGGEPSPMLTLDGTVLGTPSYMPPEQAEGRVADVDGRADVYSAGAMLYTLLTGAVPYVARGEGPSGKEVLSAVLAGPPAAIHELSSRTPAELVAICEKAMARDPGRRYARMEELAGDLRAYLENRVVRAHRTGAAAELRKWVARNRGLAAAIGAAAGLTLAALVTIVLLQSASHRETTEALEKAGAALAAEAASLEAKDEALRRAEGLRFLSESSALVGSSPGTALLLALEGARRAPGAPANSALAAALDVLVEERTTPRHGDLLTCAALSPDGRRLATAAWDGTVRVWSRATGEIDLVLRGHHRAMTWVAWSPSGERLASSSWDATARIWDAGSGRQLRALRHGGVVDRVVFSPDGRALLSACRDGIARLWDVESGRLRRALAGHRGPILHGAFAPGGGVAATASADGAAILWDLDRGETLHVLRGHEDAVAHVELDAVGGRAVTASADRRARVWSVETGECLAVLHGHSGGVAAAAFVDGGRGVVTGSTDRTCVLWDVAAARAVAVLASGADEISSLVIDVPRRLALAAAGRRAAVWRLPRLPDAPPAFPERIEPLAELAGHEERIVSAELSAGGDAWVTASLDGSARVWSVARALDLGRFRELDFVRRGALSRDGRMAVSYGHGRVAHLLDGKTAERLGLLEGHEGWISSAEFSPDGRSIVTTSFDRTARIWSAATAETLRVLRGHGAEIDYAEFSPDGTRVVTGSRDFLGRVWDVERGVEISRLATEGWVWAPRFCRDGASLVISVNAGVEVWDPVHGKRLRTYAGHRSPVYFCWARPGSPWVLTVSINNHCHVWDTDTLETIARLEGHEGEVAAAAFGGDGRDVATLDGEGTVRVWSVPDGSPRLVVRAGARGPARLAFSPDGAEVVAKLVGGARRWPLVPLTEALARSPRELSAVERERFGIGDAGERARAREAEVQRAAAAERIALAGMWSRDRTNLRARREFVDETGRAVSSLLRRDPRAALEAAEEALEWDGGRDRVVAWWLAVARSNAGDVAAAARALDAGLRLPPAESEASVHHQAFAEWCRRLAPDAVACAGVDVLLAQRSRLVATGDGVRFRRGTRGPLDGEPWPELGFDDAAWEEGAGPIGFGDARCRTHLGNVPEGGASMFIRSRFDVADPSALSGLRASIDIAGDAIVWVNGREVTRHVQRAPGLLLPPDADAEDHALADPPLQSVEVVIDPCWLVSGANVLAVACSSAGLGGASLMLALGIESEPRADLRRDQELLARFRELASGPDRELRERYFEGRVLARAGRHREAVEKLRAACAAGPGAPLATCSLAESLRALGEDAEAARLLEDLIDRGPAIPEDEPRILLAASARLARRGGGALESYVRAARWARRAAEIRPRDAAPHAILGAACLRAALPARSTRALEGFEAALALAEALDPRGDAEDGDDEARRRRGLEAAKRAAAVLRRAPPRPSPEGAGAASPEIEAAIGALLAPW
jgi:WD40 repeat protein